MCYFLLSSLCPGAEEQWSMTILVNYENGVSQRFNSTLDGSFSTDYDPNLNEHRANTQAEPIYDQLCYQGNCFDIKTDAPFLNMINETDGRRETRRLPANYSPRLLGLSQVDSFIQLYVISTESGTCQSHHELKVVIFSTSYCELGGDTWCAYQGGPLTLTTGVPCSAKLPRMAIAPIDTDMMVLLDSNPQSGFLKCILIKPGQRLCSLGGDTLPKNRLENHYFFNTSSQETLVQVHLMEHNSFVQYIIDQFGYVRLLYSSDNTEKNPQCPMLSPNIFNCTVGRKFWNGTKLVHLDGAIGEPQSFQRNGTSGVAYVMQEGGESAVVVVHALLSGGRQVLDNSTQVCRDSTAVKSVYILGGGSVIVVARCFPNENLVFQVYLYQAKKACYELVPTRQPLQLKSGQVLNVLLIGHPFLVSPDAVPSITALPPGGHSTVTPAPGLNISDILAVTIPVLVFFFIVIVSVNVGVSISIIVYWFCRKGKRSRLRRTGVESKECLLDNEVCEDHPDNIDRVRGSETGDGGGDGDGDGDSDGDRDGDVNFIGNMAWYIGGSGSLDSEARGSPSLPSTPKEVAVELHPLTDNSHAPSHVNPTETTVPTPISMDVAAHRREQVPNHTSKEDLTPTDGKCTVWCSFRLCTGCILLLCEL